MPRPKIGSLVEGGFVVERPKNRMPCCSGVYYYYCYDTGTILTGH